MSDAPEAAEGRNPLLRAFVIIYATLAILALAVPDPVLVWFEDASGYPAGQAASDVVQKVGALSKRLGLDVPYTVLRGCFLVLSDVDPASGATCPLLGTPDPAASGAS